MNILKKVLTKDYIKGYKPNSKHASTHMTMVKDKSYSNRNDWTNIDNFIECKVAYHNTIWQAIHARIQSLIKKSFIQGQLIIPSEILVKSLISIFQQYYPENDFDYSKTNFNRKEQKINHLLQFLEKIKKDQQRLNHSKKNSESYTIVQQLQICIDLTKTYLDQQIAKRKEKQLHQYDKIICILKPAKKKPQKAEQKRQNMQKLKNKLMHSLSSGNLHIKVTTQEISFQKKNRKPSQRKISHKKSEGNLTKFDHQNKLRSPKNEGQIKLQKFFKDPSLKIVKTTVEYDYNAILQGSKVNIQYRKKTFDDRNVVTEDSSRVIKSKDNFEVTNINKVKKDQAFVFYRPKAQKK